jgi:hypothetical protein
MNLRTIGWGTFAFGCCAFVIAAAALLGVHAPAESTEASQDCAAEPTPPPAETGEAPPLVNTSLPARQMPATGSAGLLQTSDEPAAIQACPSASPIAPATPTATVPEPSATPEPSPTGAVPEFSLPGGDGGGGNSGSPLPPGSFY